MSKYILSESMVSTIALYMILQKLVEPFEKWDAFKLGLIDKNGKKLREPVKAKELEAWDLLTKFVWNFKKLLDKFVGKSKLAHYLSAAYLLKDSVNSVFYIKHNQQVLNETLLLNFNYTKQNIVTEMIKDLPIIDSKINENNFEYYIMLVLPKIETFLEKIDKEKFLC